MKDEETVLAVYRESQKATPAERWRKPAIPVAVEHDTSRASWDPIHKAWRPMVNYTYDADTIERFRTGRLCIECQEPQESPFPGDGKGNHLPFCTIDMSKDQVGRFAEEFEGEKWIGPTTSLTDEFDKLDDKGKRRIHNPQSQILVKRPSGLIIPDDAA